MTSSLWSYQLTSRTGEPQGRQFLADLLRDLHRVAVGLFVDVEQDRRLPSSTMRIHCGMRPSCTVATSRTRTTPVASDWTTISPTCRAVITL
jgi:hypothetical protein